MPQNTPDDSQFETWLSKRPHAPDGYIKQDMREAYFAGLKEARNGHAESIISAWAHFRGQPMPWKKACQAVAIVCRLTANEEMRLIALDDEVSSDTTIAASGVFRPIEPRPPSSPDVPRAA